MDHRFETVEHRAEMMRDFVLQLTQRQENGEAGLVAELTALIQSQAQAVASLRSKFTGRI